MAMMASKISIGIFLLRIVFDRLHKWIIYVAMAISAAAGFIFFFITLFQCSPISYFWNKGQDGQCIDPQTVVLMIIIYSVLAIITDLTFVILPMYLVWHLNIKPKDKLALLPLLGMGCMYVCLRRPDLSRAKLTTADLVLARLLSSGFHTSSSLIVRTFYVRTCRPTIPKSFFH